MGAGGATETVPSLFQRYSFIIQTPASRLGPGGRSGLGVETGAKYNRLRRLWSYRQDRPAPTPSLRDRDGPVSWNRTQLTR